MDFVLLKAQRNELFLLVKAEGLRTEKFEWSAVRSKWAGPSKVSQLTHRPTGFYFVFDTYVKQFNPRHFPASSFVAREQDASNANTWPKICEVFSEWLKLIVEEHLEPDLWESAQTAKALMPQSIEEVDNTPFAPEEIARISKSIVELRTRLLSLSANNAAQRAIINSRLNHLDESASRLGRKDWITLAIGTLTNIVVGVSLAPEAAKDLLRTAGSLLGWVLGSVILLP